ncbi:hypothetical protein H8K32_13150 [Undibacterium jejuense]|uniref:DUF3828 domain-containing protein n=1 Tax=Undibacterium jejuense TaxID=1344949 RepID=A0A923KIQ7_9BURK|nr:hypothetical protein [Undibacterium jejuense]MBC3863052.1 hypothetical protein [Undibacterium jejuense]
MKKFFSMYAASIFFLGVSMTAMNNAEAQSVSERNGFIAENPFIFIKRAFLVRDNEKEIVEEIESASTSIARFAMELMETKANSSKDSLKQVLPGSREQLRLLPEATNGRDLYIYSVFYCWKLIDPDQLQVQIEWGDITTPQRYTDSYVFLRKGSEWYFSRHGDLIPFRYSLKGYEFKRPCSN